jgi:glycosyltransferase involved in cell wall biosynthesis
MFERRLLFYIGGFAPIGGIETFVHDVLLGIGSAISNRRLLIWGNSPAKSAVLAELCASGVQVDHTGWRWGCRWNIPDIVLLPAGVFAVRRSDVVVFKRPPPRVILRLLRLARRCSRRKPDFVLITPYRPAEYWKTKPSAGELSNFDTIVVQSEEGREDLRRFDYLGKIHTIPLLPPPPEPTQELPSRRNPQLIRLGFLGRFEPQKNLTFLLDVFQILSGSGSGPSRKYELHLFGDGSELPKLRSMCSALQLHNVVFHGGVAHPDTPRAIDSCDLFMNTSVSEGQCLVAFEVLSRGRAMVATPVGALPEVLASRELGRLAPAESATAFATAVAELASLVQQGRLTAESVAQAFRARYDRAAILQEYIKLFAGEVQPDAL